MATASENINFWKPLLGEGRGILKLAPKEVLNRARGFVQKIVENLPKRVSNKAEVLRALHEGFNEPAIDSLMKENPGLKVDDAKGILSFIEDARAFRDDELKDMELKPDGYRTMALGCFERNGEKVELHLSRDGEAELKYLLRDFSQGNEGGRVIKLPFYNEAINRQVERVPYEVGF